MRLVILILGLALLPLLSWGQHTVLQGRVTDKSGQPISHALVGFPATKRHTHTNPEGYFSIKTRQSGQVKLVAFSMAYTTLTDTLFMSAQTDTIQWNPILLPLETTLDPVSVQAKRNKVFGLRKLAGLERFGIYEGRKTEVIQLEAITANKATNNARQVFSRIAGLNIWESDCGGLQIGIGGRGLNPNRSTNFNARQNDYDIAAEAIGYPESYYAPPLQAVDRVEMVRGAASLQYGPQFGGMVNFIMKEGPSDQAISLNTEQTIGSYGLYNSFNSIGGEIGQNHTLNYYAYYQYKTGNCWRANSAFDQHQAYGQLKLRLGKTDIKLYYTQMNYLAQQAGGLTDRLFELDPQQSIRARNWFRVDWYMPALDIEHTINTRSKVELHVYGLVAQRLALGRLDRINVADLGGPRDLITDRFHNLGMESRFVQRFALGQDTSSLVVGLRAYRTFTQQAQGLGSADSSANFELLDLSNPETLGFDIPARTRPFAFDLPNENYAAFAEQIIPIGNRFTLTPGLRYEYITTRAEGSTTQYTFDLAGNVIASQTAPYERKRSRGFLLAGIGLSAKLPKELELYANISQNYRPVLFNDLRISNPNIVIDENLQDERGFNADLGFRGRLGDELYLDATLFYLQYNNQIGLLLQTDTILFNDFRYRTNIADSRTIGLETLVEWNFWQTFFGPSAIRWSVFSNFTVLDGRYIRTDDSSIRGRERELVPPIIFRTGSDITYRAWKASLLYSYVHRHYTDATNAEFSSTAVVGVIPSYYVMDFSTSYDWRWIHLEAGINNLTDNRYFTRRATGYPGPGVIPAEARSFYLSLGLRL